jgi:hypothetical protein
MKKLTLIALLLLCSVSMAYAEEKKFVAMPKMPTLSNQQANVFLTTEQLGAGKEQTTELGSAYRKTHCSFGSGRARACF